MSMPEKMFRSLLGGLGINAEDVVKGLNFIIGETRDIKTDREAYKAGVQRFVPDVLARMGRIEAALADIQSRLPPRVIEAQAEPKTINGELHHG